MQLSDRIDRVLEALEQTDLSLLDFLSAVLSLEQYKGHPVVQLWWSCGKEAGEKLTHLLGCQSSHDETSDLRAAYKATTTAYVHEVCKASSEDSGSHFNISHTSVTQLEEFSVEKMGKQMEEYAPNIWKLLSALLDARHVRTHVDKDGDQIMDTKGDDEDVYWQELGETDLDGPVIGQDAESLDARGLRVAKRAAMRRALITLVRNPSARALCWSESVQHDNGY